MQARAVQTLPSLQSLCGDFLLPPRPDFCSLRCSFPIVPLFSCSVLPSPLPSPMHGEVRRLDSAPTHPLPFSSPLGLCWKRMVIKGYRPLKILVLHVLMSGKSSCDFSFSFCQGSGYTGHTTHKGGLLGLFFCFRPPRPILVVSSPPLCYDSLFRCVFGSFSGDF